MADEKTLQTLRISPGFLTKLQEERSLSHDAFLAAIASAEPFCPTVFIRLRRLKHSPVPKSLPC